MAKFKEGDRIKLKANVKEGWKEEFGIVDGYSGGSCYVVTIDRMYRCDELDDGIREVTTNQMVKLDNS